MRKKLISVLEARYVSGYMLRVRFNDGSEKTIDFSTWLQGEVFRPLREVRLFKKFFVSGGTVCWPNGADIAPETLHAASDASATAA